MNCDDDCPECARELLQEVTEPIGSTEVTYKIWECVAYFQNEDDYVDHGDGRGHEIKCVIRFKEAIGGAFGWTILDKPGEPAAQLLDRARGDVLRSYNNALKEQALRDSARVAGLGFQARFSDGTCIHLNVYYHRRSWWVESDGGITSHGETLEAVLAGTQHELTRGAKMFIVGFEPR